MVCGGKASVLIEPIIPPNSSSFFTSEIEEKQKMKEQKENEECFDCMIRQLTQTHKNQEKQKKTEKKQNKKYFCFETIKLEQMFIYYLI